MQSNDTYTATGKHGGINYKKGQGLTLPEFIQARCVMLSSWLLMNEEASHYELDTCKHARDRGAAMTNYPRCALEISSNSLDILVMSC